MRIALLSDIHANLPALEAVLADLDRRNDRVAGNYDSTTATDYKHCGSRYEDPRQDILKLHNATPRDSQ